MLFNFGKKCYFLRKRRTFSERGCHFCEFCENDACFPWIEFVDFPKNSLSFHEKRTVSEKGRHFREFCENDARFPWVEFVDFPQNSLKFHQEFIIFSVKTHKFNKCSRKTHVLRKMTSFL